MRSTKRTAVVVVALTLTGCVTHFYGSPKVENGPRGCWDQCQAWGMDLVGMVKMGEYSDGCICQVRPPPQQPGAPQSGAQMKLDGPAVAGVWMQMQAEAAAAQAAQLQQSQQHRTWGGSGGSGGPGHH